MTLASDTSLKVLENFIATDEWVLNPGDMLYLPPKVAHHGVAIGECTTFSVGFRAPSATEMLDDLATELLSRDLVPNHLTDPPLTEAMANAPISGEYVQRIKALLLETLDDDQMLGQWFTQFMTEPKYPSLVELTEEVRSATFENQISEGEEPSYTHYVNGLKQD